MIRLWSVPYVVFSRLVWPVIRSHMPEKLVKRIGLYRLVLDGRKLNHVLRYLDLWEPRYRRAIFKHVSLGSRVLELGGAYGYFTLLLADRVRPTGRVLAIEPFPPYYKELVRLRCANAIVHLRILNVGVGDSARMSFEFGAGDPNPYAGLQRVNPVQFGIESGAMATAEASAIRVKVPTVTLPGLLLAEGFYPDVIVMDIEGAELFVIEQLVQMDLRPILFFEVHPSFTGEDKMNRSLEVLAEAGYALEQIDDRHFRANIGTAEG